MVHEEETLDIIDENDSVIGTEARAHIHKEGLLHREVHIWFITPRGEVIFQHRAKNIVTRPNLLDATVGGHVESGASYDDTAIKECKEETGVEVELDHLVFLHKIRRTTHDSNTGMVNNTLRAQYVYLYEGDIDHLQVEEGKAIGFEAWGVDVLTELSDDDTQRFNPAVISDEYHALFKKGAQVLLS